MTLNSSAIEISYITLLFEEVATEVNDDIVVGSQCLIDFVRDPPFHDFNIDLLHVNSLSKLRGEFGLLQELLIHRTCHDRPQERDRGVLDISLLQFARGTRPRIRSNS